MSKGRSRAGRRRGGRTVVDLDLALGGADHEHVALRVHRVAALGQLDGADHALCYARGKVYSLVSDDALEREQRRGERARRRDARVRRSQYRSCLSHPPVMRYAEPFDALE